MAAKVDSVRSSRPLKRGPLKTDERISLSRRLGLRWFEVTCDQCAYINPGHKNCKLMPTFSLPANIGFCLTFKHRSHRSLDEILGL